MPAPHGLLSGILTVCLKIKKKLKNNGQYLTTSAIVGFHAGSLFWLNWNLECWFLWREEKRSTRRIAFGASQEATTNSTHM